MKKIVIILVLFVLKGLFPIQIFAQVEFFKLPYQELKDAIQFKQQQQDKYLQELRYQELEEYRRVQKCKYEVISYLNTFSYVKEPSNGGHNVYAFTDDLCDVRKVYVKDRKVVAYICFDGVVAKVLLGQEISRGYTRIKVRRMDDHSEFFVELYFADLFTNYE